MTTPRKNESDQVKYIRFLARQLKEGATKATSNYSRESLLSSSDFHRNLANFLSGTRFLEQECPQGLNSVIEESTKRHGPIDVNFVLGVSALAKVILIKHSYIPDEDKDLIIEIYKKAHEYSKTLGNCYVS